MTDQTVSEEVTTPVVDDADVAETEIDTEAEAESEAKPSSADTLENEGEIAADYLEELLDIADLDGDIDTYVEGGRAHVSIVTDGDLLVGSDGAVLEALQELARLAVMTAVSYTHLTLPTKRIV